MAKSTPSNNIRNLTRDLYNVTVTGIILYRSPSRHAKTLTILLRDSKDYSVNCVIWGPQSYIQEQWDKCECAQVVTVSYCRVSQSSNEYHPAATSPFIITASDRSEISVVKTKSPLHGLLHWPIRPIELCLRLEDIRINGEQGVGQYSDVCVLLRQVRPTRQVTMKDGGVKRVRECVVCDKSSAGLLLTLWSEDFIQRSDQWQAISTVLHIVNARVGYSAFYKSRFLMTTSRTVIQDNPEHHVSEGLVEFGLSMNPFEGESFSIDAEKITNVMTCQRLLDRIESRLGVGDEDQFTGVVYGILTKFNIDQEGRGISKKWWVVFLGTFIEFLVINDNFSSFCHSPVDVECMEGVCLELRYQTSDTTYQVYYFRMDLSDHTGTISNCRLMDAEAERTLNNCSAEQFHASEWSQRCSLKWKYLMERCRVKVVAYKRTAYRPYSFVRIVELTLADHGEVLDVMKIY